MDVVLGGEDSEEFKIFISYLEHISNGKTVYLSTIGSKGIDPEYILHSAEDITRPCYYKIHVKEASHRSITREIFENESVIFYIFNEPIRWEDYLCTKEIKWLDEIKDGRLNACISFGECESVETDVSKACENAKELLVELEKIGYKAKSLLSFF